MKQVTMMHTLFIPAERFGQSFTDSTVMFSVICQKKSSQRLVTYGSSYKYNHIGYICENRQNRLGMMHLHLFVRHLGTQMQSES
jgi:hypothetical protein